MKARKGYRSDKGQENSTRGMLSLILSSVFMDSLQEVLESRNQKLSKTPLTKFADDEIIQVKAP